MQRREFLGVILKIALATTFIPIQAIAAIWNKSAFGAIKLEDATQNLDIDNEVLSKDIIIMAPERAENGAVVQIEIMSNIANTEAIALFVDKNPTPLIGNFMFTNGALPFLITRIKMAEDSNVKVVVKAGNQYYSNSRKVIVLENGCG